MEFNLWMLKNQMSQMNPDLNETASDAFCLKGIRFYDHKIKCDENMAYFVTDHNIRYLEKENPEAQLSFILMSEPAYASFPENWSVMQLHTKKSSTAVFQLLVDTVMELQNWYDELISLILEQADLQVQMDVATRFLKNPIAVFDMSTVLVAWAGKLPEELTDPVWSNVLHQGYNTLETFPIEVRSELANSIGRRHLSIVPPLSQKEAVHNMMATLYHNQMPLAWIAMNELNAPFDYAEISYVRIIQSVLEKSPVLLRNLVLSEKRGSKIFQRLIQGSTCDDVQMQIFMRENNLSPKNSYRLYYFQFPQKEKLHEESCHSYMELINRFVPDLILFYYENAVLGIRKLTQNPKTDTDIRIDDIKIRTGILVGGSMVFSDYNNLNHAYKQSMTAWRYANENHALVYYEEISDRLLSDTLKTMNPISYIHSALFHFNPDNEWDRELMKSLETYLMNGKKVSATASILHIHRNTLLYRIQLINEQLGLNIDHLTEKEEFFLKISTMIYNILKT